MLVLCHGIIDSCKHKHPFIHPSIHPSIQSPKESVPRSGITPVLVSKLFQFFLCPLVLIRVEFCMHIFNIEVGRSPMEWRGKEGGKRDDRGREKRERREEEGRVERGLCGGYLLLI